MVKANAVSSPGQTQKMIAADMVSVLLVAMDKNITLKHYEMMSALDGTRTASGFEHQFRSILAKAKELKKRIADGETFEPVQPGVKRNASVAPATPRKRKASADEHDGSPAVKKSASKPRAKKGTEVAAHVEEEADAGDGFPRDASEFIKSEQNWEEKFI